MNKTTTDIEKLNKINGKNTKQNVYIFQYITLGISDLDENVKCCLGN